MEAAYREYLAHYGNVTLLENSYKQKEQLWNQIVGVVKSSAYVASGVGEAERRWRLTLLSGLRPPGPTSTPPR